MITIRLNQQTRKVHITAPEHLPLRLHEAVKKIYRTLRLSGYQVRYKSAS